MQYLSDAKIRELCSTMTEEQIMSLAGNAERVYEICRGVYNKRLMEVPTGRMSPRKTQLYVKEYGGMPMFGGGGNYDGYPKREDWGYDGYMNGNDGYTNGYDSYKSKSYYKSPRSARKYSQRYGGKPYYGGGGRSPERTLALAGAGGLIGAAAGGIPGLAIGAGTGLLAGELL